PTRNGWECRCNDSS
ncbi:matrix protein 2, partial [Influenza A virus (A/northern pintail/California/44291-259/2007(H10N3))]